MFHPESTTREDLSRQFGQETTAKLEEVGHRIAAFKLAEIDPSKLLFRTGRTPQDLKTYADIVHNYVSCRKSGKTSEYTENDALAAIKSLEACAKKLKRDSLLEEFKRLDNAYDQRLADQAKRNLYRKEN
jgi:hypothetical protein